jgi:hypothetical protein
MFLALVFRRTQSQAVATSRGSTAPPDGSVKLQLGTPQPSPRSVHLPPGPSGSPPASSHTLVPLHSGPGDPVPAAAPPGRSPRPDQPEGIAAKDSLNLEHVNLPGQDPFGQGSSSPESARQFPVRGTAAGYEEGLASLSLETVNDWPTGVLVGAGTIGASGADGGSVPSRGVPVTSPLVETPARHARVADPAVSVADVRGPNAISGDASAATRGAVPSGTAALKAQKQNSSEKSAEQLKQHPNETSAGRAAHRDSRTAASAAADLVCANEAAPSPQESANRDAKKGSMQLPAPATDTPDFIIDSSTTHYPIVSDNIRQHPVVSADAGRAVTPIAQIGTSPLDHVSQSSACTTVSVPDLDLSVSPYVALPVEEAMIVDASDPVPTTQCVSSRAVVWLCLCLFLLLVSQHRFVAVSSI